MKELTKDFTPTKETISLHGTGFIQIKLGGKMRMHVWHPDLPQTEHTKHDHWHNHRFSFGSVVLKGALQNRVLSEVRGVEHGDYMLWSHDGPRLPSGNRETIPVGRYDILRDPPVLYEAGSSYSMIAGEYHQTAHDGVAITLMIKTFEGTEHASSLVRHPFGFDTEFNRNQLSPDTLFDFVKDALK